VQAADLAQHAVDAIADAQEILLGLEVDVRSRSFDRVGQQCRYEAHHRLRVLVAFGEGGVVDLAGLDLAQDAVDREFVAVVVLDRPLDLGLAGEPQLDLELAIQVGAQLVHRDDVVGVGEGDDEFLVLAVDRDREDAVAPRHVARQQLERRRIDDDVREVDRLHAEFLGQGVAQRRLGDEAELHQQAPDRHVRFRLLEQRDAQLVLGQDSLVDQDLPDVALGLGIGGRIQAILLPGLLSSRAGRRGCARRRGRSSRRAFPRARPRVGSSRLRAWTGAGGRG
jgi:hypothetical protein